MPSQLHNVTLREKVKVPKRSLTAAAVQRIKPPKDGHVNFFDKGYPGLSLRVSYGGAKAYDYFFRLHGRLRRITLGRHPSMSLADARAAWREARTHVGHGEDPTEPDRHRPTALLQSSKSGCGGIKQRTAPALT